MIRDQETLNILLDTLSRFVRERLIPQEATVAEHDEIPAALVSEMKELGLFGLSLPEEYGGMGLTMEEEVMAYFEVAQASPAFRSLFATNNGIGAQGIVIDGSDAQKAHYLPRLATGEIIGAYCLSEPNSGSDALSLSECGATESLDTECIECAHETRAAEIFRRGNARSLGTGLLRHLAVAVRHRIASVEHNFSWKLFGQVTPDLRQRSVRNRN